MTTEERLIISAYTGVLMTDIVTFRKWLSTKGYVDPLLGLTVTDVSKAFDKLQEQTKFEFLALCEYGR